LDNNKEDKAERVGWEVREGRKNKHSRRQRQI